MSSVGFFISGHGNSLIVFLKIFTVLTEKPALCHITYFCMSWINGTMLVRMLCPVFYPKVIYCLLAFTPLFVLKKFLFKILSAETISTYVETIHPSGLFWQVEEMIIWTQKEVESLILWNNNHLHIYKWKIVVKIVVSKRKIKALKQNSSKTQAEQEFFFP